MKFLKTPSGNVISEEVRTYLDVEYKIKKLKENEISYSINDVFIILSFSFRRMETHLWINSNFDFFYQDKVFHETYIGDSIPFFTSDFFSNPSLDHKSRVRYHISSLLNTYRYTSLFYCLDELEKDKNLIDKLSILRINSEKNNLNGLIKANNNKKKVSKI